MKINVQRVENMLVLPATKQSANTSGQWLYLLVLVAAGLVSPTFFKTLVLAGDLFLHSVEHFEDSSFTHILG